jgi:hypothetical protein
MIDLGTGDGAAVLDGARGSATTLCVGVDADASRLREASARAARPARRGGLPNALFLAADATAIPIVFAGCADEITITLPWGSLLRAILAGDERFAADLARTLTPGGRLRVLLSIEDRDRAAIGGSVADPDLDGFAAALESAGLEVVRWRDVAAKDMAAIRSSWARRLGIPSRRSAGLLVARRPIGAAALESGLHVDERRPVTSTERPSAAHHDSRCTSPSVGSRPRR